MFGDFNNFIEIFRKSSQLYNGRAITATINLDPEEAAIIRATLDSAQSGTIALYGSTLETLTFTSQQYQETTATFTTLTGMTVTGLTGDVKIETVNHAREPIMNTIEVQTAFGKYSPIGNIGYMKPMGKEDDYKATLLLQKDVRVQTDDIIYVDRASDASSDPYYIVKECVTIQGNFGESHKELILK